MAKKIITTDEDLATFVTVHIAGMMLIAYDRKLTPSEMKEIREAIIMDGGKFEDAKRVYNVMIGR